MILLILGLLVYTISVYGAAWVITQGGLFEPLRNGLASLAVKTQDVPVIKTITYNIAYLFQCIVCTGVWVGITYALLAGKSVFLSQTFPPVFSPFDVVLWASWSAGTVWMLSTKFDPEE